MSVPLQKQQKAQSGGRIVTNTEEVYQYNEEGRWASGYMMSAFVGHKKSICYSKCKESHM